MVVIVILSVAQSQVNILSASRQARLLKKVGWLLLTKQVKRLTIIDMRTQRAVEHFGGIPELARALGITRHAIYQWGSEVPQLRQYQLEKITGGKLMAGSGDGDVASSGSDETGRIPA